MQEDNGELLWTLGVLSEFVSVMIFLPNRPSGPLFVWRTAGIAPSFPIPCWPKQWPCTAAPNPFLCSWWTQNCRSASYQGWLWAMGDVLSEPSIKFKGVWFFLPVIWRPFKPREVASAVPHFQGQSLGSDARWQPGPYPSPKRDPRWQNSYHHCTCQRFHVSYHFAEGKCLSSVTVV